MNAVTPTSFITPVAADAMSQKALSPSRRRWFPEGLFRETSLRSTLLGEYASLLLLCHSLFGAVSWSVYVLQNPSSLVMVLAGLWIALRAVGGCAGEKWAAGVSLLMLLMTGVLAITGVAHVPAWLTGSIVAPVVWTVLLGLLLVVDFLDIRLRSHADLSLPERRKRDGRSLRRAFAGLFLAWGLGVPAATLIHQLSRPPLGKAQMEELSFIEHTGFRCGEALVAACFFAFGCNIGSFLNVVVWRMPLGKSIVFEKSSCPNCATSIGGKDNIPIFGWLSLGGQCRACSTEISPRYPVVEAITGSIFLMLFFVELISGGANLPVRGINTYRGVLWTIMYPKWDLIGIYLYHCFLYSSLLVFALMQVDGSRIPRRLLTFCFVMAMASPVVFPALQLIAPLPNDWLPNIAAARSLLHGFAGATCGMIAGVLLRHRLNIDEDSSNQSSSLTASLSLIGVMLGWQAVLCISALFWTGRVIRDTGFRLNGSSPKSAFTGDLLVVALIHHVLWRMEWAALAGMKSALF